MYTCDSPGFGLVHSIELRIDSCESAGERMGSGLSDIIEDSSFESCAGPIVNVIVMRFR